MGEDIGEGCSAENLDATSIENVVSLKMLENMMKKKGIL